MRMREESKRKLGETARFQLEQSVINKRRKKEGRKTDIGRSRSGAPSRGTQLNLSLWTAGLEARHCTIEKNGLTSVGSPAAYFQTHLVSLFGCVLLLLFKKLPPFLLEILKKDGKKRKKKEKQRETDRERGWEQEGMKSGKENGK